MYNILNLVKKEFEILSGNKIHLIFPPLLFILLVFGPNIVFGFSLIAISSLINNTDRLLANKTLHLLANKLPVTRNESILASHLYSLILCLACCLYNFFANFLTYDNFNDAIIMTLLHAFIIISYIAILNSFYLYSKKGPNFLLFYIPFIFAFIFITAEKGIFTFLYFARQIDLNILIFLTLLLCITIIYISYIISNKLYKNFEIL